MNDLSLFNTLFNSAFDDGFPEFNIRATTAMPKVDVKKSNDHYTLEMEIPGFTEKDVNIELDRNVLTISSVKESVSKPKTESENSEKVEKDNNEVYLVRERKSTSFTRRFTLPEDIDPENISASFKNGILFVTIGRKALSTPKRIAIDVA